MENKLNIEQMRCEKILSENNIENVLINRINDYIIDIDLQTIQYDQKLFSDLLQSLELNQFVHSIQSKCYLQSCFKNYHDFTDSAYKILSIL